MKTPPSVYTLGELRKSGYVSRSVKEELRKNLLQKLESGEPAFEGIYGYEDTVLPQLQTAILSRHNIILLGLRGQAKTRLARMLVTLLDEWMPAIAGTEINDDPFAPISWKGRQIVEELGENTPITWIHRDERFTEKLATPDVSVADLIGDLDPIKAAALKLSYDDERVIHYGLIPRSHRSIFVINELPDLQARIQVALFNILQEGDIQIRGFKLRLPLDLQFIFTANPEDYTNRGSIVTPLKDRIDSQILTHYPSSIEVSRNITLQEARITEEQRKKVNVHHWLIDLIEQVAFEARESDLVDKKSGVSARLTISALENLYSSAERRILLNQEPRGSARVSDLYGVIPAITGKVELVYEGELEGMAVVAQGLVGKAIRSLYTEIFPDPLKAKKSKKPNPYEPILQWFAEGNSVELDFGLKEEEYRKRLDRVQGLADFVYEQYGKAVAEERYFLMEWTLYALSEFNQLGKGSLKSGFQMRDLMSGLLSGGDFS